MIQAIDPKSPFKYIPKCERDKPAEEQSAFFLRPLTARQNAVMQDKISEICTDKNRKEAVIRVHSGSQVLSALEMGLVGWENFKGVDGKDIPFRAGAEEMFDYIPADVRRELAEVVIEGRELPEIAEKN